MRISAGWPWLSSTGRACEAEVTFSHPLDVSKRVLSERNTAPTEHVQSVPVFWRLHMGPLNTLFPVLFCAFPPPPFFIPLLYVGFGNDTSFSGVISGNGAAVYIITNCGHTLSPNV